MKRRAGAVLRWDENHDHGEEPLEFVLLQDRAEAPPCPDPGCVCLVLSGEVYGVLAGGLVALRGIVDAAVEVEA